MTPAPDILRHFAATDPKLIAQTGIANIWKVRVANDVAALKIYHGDDTKDEWAGFTLLQALDGQGAAKVLGLFRSSALLEWLDGPSLGDMARQGNDAKAGVILAQTANKIHASNVNTPLPSLENTLNELLALQISPMWHRDTQKAFQSAKTLAHDLLASSDNACPLHGDLHHDNVKQGAHGYVAFDAKGLRGDRGYDMANAFKNPFDRSDIFTPPTRIQRLAQNFATTMELPPKRLLGWAAVHCAAAMIWSGTAATDPLNTHLQALLAAHDQQI